MMIVLAKTDVQAGITAILQVYTEMSVCVRVVFPVKQGVTRAQWSGQQEHADYTARLPENG